MPSPTRSPPAPSALAPRARTARPREARADARASLGGSVDPPPDHFGYQATAWTIPLLQSHLAHWGLTGFCDATVRRQLHALGYVWKRPRYVLDPDPRRAAKMRRIRQYIKGLGPRDCKYSVNPSSKLGAHPRPDHHLGSPRAPGLEFLGSRFCGAATRCPMLGPLPRSPMRGVAPG